MIDGLRPGLRPRSGEVDAPSNVLLLAPLERASSTCAEHAFLEASEELAVLTVEFPRRTPDSASAWTAGGARWPTAIKLLSVGEGSPRMQTGERLRERAPDHVAIQAVTVGDDLHLAGIEVAGTLGSWQDAYEDVVLCLDSLTSLVRFAGVDRTYRFLQVLTGLVRQGDVRAHYHLDPTRHGLRTTYLLETLTDAFVLAGDVDLQPPPH